MIYKYIKCLKKNYKIIIVILITFLLLLKTIYSKGKDIPTEIEDINIQTEIIEENNPALDNVEFIYVDIKGAVVDPGVKKIEKDKRIIDVINLSGGLKQEADTTLINLSKKLFDEMVIIIYTEKEVKENSEKNKIVCEETKYIYVEVPTNNACVVENSNQVEEENEKAEANQKEEANSRVSLNSATLEELMTIPKIGEAKAKAIITYREENNGFKSIDELLNISGIGQTIFEQIKDLVIL